MKYGQMVIPAETITNKYWKISTFKFFIRTAHGEGLPVYQDLIEIEPTDEEEEADEGHDLGPKYLYSIKDKNLHERIAAMMGFFHEEMIKRLQGFGENHFFGDDSYFDYTPAYIFNFYQLCVILQAHDIWNTFIKAAMQTPYVLDQDEENSISENFEEVKWAFPEELEVPWDTYMNEAE